MRASSDALRRPVTRRALERFHALAYVFTAIEHRSIAKQVKPGPAWRMLKSDDFLQGARLTLQLSREDVAGFIALLGKYENLTWYAVAPADTKGADARRADIESAYPEEVALLNGPRREETYGFNLGAMATLRLVIEALEGDRATAWGTFPSIAL